MLMYLNDDEEQRLHFDLDAAEGAGTNVGRVSCRDPFKTTKDVVGSPFFRCTDVLLTFFLALYATRSCKKSRALSVRTFP